MKKIISLFLFIFTSTLTFAQSDNDVVLDIEGEKITKKTFVELYQKNNPNPNKTIDKKDLQDYLELFINYKLKLKEARILEMDKDPNYISEVKTYRDQLIEPYINDRNVTDALVEEAYERTKEIVRASHILIGIPANATPADTLSSYNRALEIRKRIIKGEDFSKLAIELSEDPSAKDQSSGQDGKKSNYKGNKGDLGYFTSFSMIYPFESACYSMKIGDISLPIRTSRGYHIIKLTDRMPAFFSTADIAHIWVNFDNHDSKEECKRLIDEAYKMLQNNVSFDSVVGIYSDDKYSAQKKGLLLSQRVTTLPVEYVLHLKSTSINTFSEPFETRFGWHIIVPKTLNPIQSLEEQRQTIEQRISKDVRSFRSIEEFANKSKKEYNFKEFANKINVFNQIVTDSVFFSKWSIPTNFTQNDTLFTIGDVAYKQQDFAKYIQEKQKTQTPEYIPSFIDKLYQSFVSENVIKYADSKLEGKHPGLKATVDEFRDGILIFSITDKFVWNKSLVDSLGIESFHNKRKQNYLWKNRVDATIFTFYKDLDMKAANKIIHKGIKKEKTNEAISLDLSKKLKIKDNPSQYFDFKWGKFEKGDNKIVDKTNWKLGISPVIEDGKKKSIVIVHKLINPEVKTLDEAKGIVTSDYQEYLEQEWIKNLRSKYSYKVYDDVFNSIK